VTIVDRLLDRCDFPPRGTAVELGVSGGADSSALLVLAVAAGCEVTAVHVDHGLRASSAGEAERVAALAARYGARFRRTRVDVEEGPNLEARARAARYRVLGADALVGHTLDDRAETVLLHLLRGTGAAGFAALAPPDPRRPLLRLRRSETVALCAAEGIDVVDDASNDDGRFARNRVRHEVLPLLDAISGRDTAVLLTRTADLIAADDRLLDDCAARLDPTDAPALAAAPEPLATRRLRSWLAPVHDGYAPDAAEIERVLDVARGLATATELVGGARVARTRQTLRIEARGNGDGPTPSPGSPRGNMKPA
jgi:tRNA(Ile)-lysidine synthase